MKRSEINKLIRNAMQFCAKHKFLLPPFAFWTPAEWAKKGHEADEIRDCMLGWDVTDMGTGNFKTCGLVLFTIRNGKYNDARYPKTYCEKMLLQAEGQYTPMHFHWLKSEDIINRGGATLVIQLYNATKSEDLARSEVKITTDGVARKVRAGGTICLKPGESITLTDHIYHKFWAEGGPALLGEVSAVNDDRNDNRFHEPLGRFPKIEEDEPAQFLLCTEYPKAAKRAR